MASTIDLNKLYNYYLNKYGDKRTAAQYTAFQYLSNPSGSVAGLKEPQKYYSQDEWLSYEAPAYNQAINYTGNDPLNKWISVALKKVKSLPELQTELRKANSPDIWLKDTAYAGIPKFDLPNYSLDTNSLYTQVKDIFAQKESADKKYKTQQDTHPYAQFGLGDPNLRYTVYTNPNDTTKKYPPGQKPVFQTTKFNDTSKYVQYKPAVDYINKSSTSFTDTLLKKGIARPAALQYAAQYKVALQDAIQKKLDASPLSPFVDQVKALRPIRKP